MNVISWLKYTFAYGFHGSYLLLFSILIWAVFFLVLLSNPANKINIHCFAAGLLAGTGAFKEYLFYELGPKLIHQGLWTASFSEIVYSVLSASFYYLVMPSFLIFGLYFCHAEKEYPDFFPKYSNVCYAPAVLMALIFPVTRTHMLQSLPVFCITAGLYNWFYGILLTLLMHHTLRSNRLTAHYHQLCLAFFSVLVPLWCWMLLAFPYHALGITSISKMWQLNLFVLLLVFLFLLYHIFKDGIWGFRIKKEHYDWSSDEKKLGLTSNYIRHALNNNLAKIGACTTLLEQKGVEEKELAIIKSSVDQLNRLLLTMAHCTDKITCQYTHCDVCALLKKIQETFIMPAGKQIDLVIDSCASDLLFCDENHIEEVLNNLINNAVDAIPDQGIIRLSYRVSGLLNQAVISVQDNGPGLGHHNIQNISEPFFTTKKGNHIGLGLTYCWNVMNAHNGQLQLKSSAAGGTTFRLILPLRPSKLHDYKTRKRGILPDGENSNHISRG